VTHLPRKRRESFRFHTKLLHTEEIKAIFTGYSFNNIDFKYKYLSVVKIGFSGERRTSSAGATDQNVSAKSGDAAGKK
jgi:hypothetical protein